MHHIRKGVPCSPLMVQALFWEGTPQPLVRTHVVDVPRHATVVVADQCVIEAVRSLPMRFLELSDHGSAIQECNHVEDEEVPVLEAVRDDRFSAVRVVVLME